VRAAGVPKENADLMHAIYERITVAGPEIVSVRLTAAAHGHGLALGAAGRGCDGAPDRVGHAIAA
jgi:hypothetical protein